MLKYITEMHLITETTYVEKLRISRETQLVPTMGNKKKPAIMW